MTDQCSRRGRRRKALRAAAVVLSSAAAYPPSIGPVLYGVERGWLPASAFAAFGPAFSLQSAAVVGPAYAAYLARWWSAAHRVTDAPDPEFDPPPSAPDRVD